MTGKGFLGWSRNRDATEPEYTSGDTYIENEQVLYAVYSNTINVMSSFPSEITSINSQIDYIKFINIPVSRMEEEIVEANIVVDLTYEDIGMVIGYVIEDTLYIASEGTTYLSDGYELFKGFSNLNNIDFSNGDSYYVEDMESMFSFGTGGGIYVDNEDEDYKVMQLSENYYQEPVFSNFEGFRTDNAKTMKKMFYKVDSIDGLSFENFNTSNVEDMSYMFSTTYIREIDVSSFDTSNVTNMSHMFSNNMFLGSINVNKFNTSKVINMSRMFGGNVEYLNIDVSSFDTKNVTNMEEMFAGSNAYAGNIRYLDLRNFNTSNVTNMRSMFSDQNIIIELDLSSFNTSNVVDMSSMFAACSSMNNLVINSFDVKKVMNMSGMFSGCESLLSLDLSHFDTSNVENFSGMFSNCRNLEYLEISKFDGSCATNISSMFRMCYSLLRIDISSLLLILRLFLIMDF